MHNLGKPHFLEVMNYWSDAHRDDSHPHARPTLLILGTLEGTGNVAYAMSTWRLKGPMAKLVIVPWAGHMSNRDQPWLVNRSIRKFRAWEPATGTAKDSAAGAREQAG